MISHNFRSEYKMNKRELGYSGHNSQFGVNIDQSKGCNLRNSS